MRSSCAVRGGRSVPERPFETASLVRFVALERVLQVDLEPLSGLEREVGSLRDLRLAHLPLSDRLPMMLTRVAVPPRSGSALRSTDDSSCNRPTPTDMPHCIRWPY